MENGLASGVNIGTDIGIYDGDQTGILTGLSRGAFNEKSLYLKSIYNPSIVRNGLALYLDAAQFVSYPGTGTTWRDISGNANNGTLTNGPTFNSDKYGNILCDGSNDFITCGTNVPWNATNHTFSLWIYPFTLINQYNRFFSYYGDGSTLWTTTDPAFSPNRWSIVNAGIIQWHTNVSCTFNIFQNITFVRDSSNAFFYVNGNQLASTTSFTGNNYNNTGEVRLGNSTAFGEPAKAAFASAIIYTRSLSYSEVIQNYNATKSRFGL